MWTHIYGDARLCHVLFVEREIAGVVDHDAGMWGQRLLDVAFHLISHPDSAKVAFLGIEDILDWLCRYHRVFPFTEGERVALPAALSCALLIELGETLWSVEAGAAGLGIEGLTTGITLLDALHTHSSGLLDTAR